MTALRSLVARPDDAVTTRWLRGAELAAHVTRGLAGTQPAARIAATAGYVRLERCAVRLAESGHAPLGRDLLARAYAESLHHGFHVVSIDRSDPEPSPRPVGRPAPTADEVLWELEDAAFRGASFDDVAHTFGIRPASLRRRLERLKIANQARRHFPRLGRLLPGRPKSVAS